MSERMTDERLEQIENRLKSYLLKGSENMTTYYEWELLKALKAEREYAEKILLAALKGGAG